MSNDKQKPDCWLIVLGDSCVLSAHDQSPDFAWIAAERLSGMKQFALEAVGWRIRPVKLVFLDEKENDK